MWNPFAGKRPESPDPTPAAPAAAPPPAEQAQADQEAGALPIAELDEDDVEEDDEDQEPGGIVGDFISIGTAPPPRAGELSLSRAAVEPPTLPAPVLAPALSLVPTPPPIPAEADPLAGEILDDVRRMLRGRIAGVLLTYYTERPQPGMPRDHVRARHLVEEPLALLRRLGDPAEVEAIARAPLFVQDDLDEEQRAEERAAELREEQRLAELREEQEFDARVRAEIARSYTRDRDAHQEAAREMERRGANPPQPFPTFQEYTAKMRDRLAGMSIAERMARDRAERQARRDRGPAAA